MGKFDLVIIGGGAAAFAAALVASELGAKTLMVNDGLPLGGTCVNVGCVPSKHLLELAKDRFLMEHPRFGSLSPADSGFDFSCAIAEKDALVAELRRGKYEDVLKGFEHVEFLAGRARFVSQHEIEVSGEVISAERFLIATGARPHVPPLVGIERVPYLTHREALSLEELPDSLIIIGSGPLGMEFSQFFSRLGCEVTVLARGPRILKREEPEVSEELRRCLMDEGIQILTEVKIEGLSGDESGVAIETRIRGACRTLYAQRLMLATGIEPNTSELSLEKIGVGCDERGFIRVDETLRTTAPHIWAAGDVVGRRPLETVAAREGHVAARNALNDEGLTIDYTVIPHAVFTDPQVASVGLTEEAAMRRFNVCSCRTVRMDQVPKALAVNDSRGLLKMVAHPQTEEVIGVHIVAPLAAEMIHEAVLAVKFKLTVEDLIETVHVFPTFTEAIKLTAQSFKRDLSKMSCCVE